MRRDPDPTAPPSTDPQPQAAPRGWLRLVVVVAALVGLGLVARASGVLDALSVQALRGAVADAGPWGPVVFVVGYGAAYVAGTPGLPFVAVALAAWGQVAGGALAFVGSLVATSCSFGVARVVGTRFAGRYDLARIPWRFAREQLAHLDARPVRTIALVRAVLVLPPVLDYLLGLTTVSYPRFLLGSALGLIPPLVVAALLCEPLLRWLGL